MFGYILWGYSLIYIALKNRPKIYGIGTSKFHRFHIDGKWKHRDFDQQNVDIIMMMIWFKQQKCVTNGGFSIETTWGFGGFDY